MGAGHFFSLGTSDVERANLMKRYSVKWLVLNEGRIDDRVHSALLVPSAIVRTDQELVLLDADKWLEEKP